MATGSKSTGALAKPGGKKGKVARVVDRYEELKATVNAFLQDRFKVAAAIKEIHDDKLYLKEYETFEQFCLDEFGVTRRNAYKLIEAAEVKESLADVPKGHIVSNVLQAQTLKKVPKERRAEVLKTAAEAGPVTAKSIAAAAAPKISEPVAPEPARSIALTCSICRKEHDLTMDCPNDEPAPVAETAPQPANPVATASGSDDAESNEWWIVLPPEESAKVNEMMKSFGLSAEEIFRQAVRMLGGMD